MFQTVIDISYESRSRRLVGVALKKRKPKFSCKRANVGSEMVLPFLFISIENLQRTSPATCEDR